MMSKTLRELCVVAQQVVSISRKLATAQVASLQEAALKERCILVDEWDKPIGESSKRNCHTVNSKGQIPLHRAFSVFLFNDKEELLLQKRSPTKITFPNYYTNTCCSHPLAEIVAETEEHNALGIRKAAIRRMGYELGIPSSEIAPSDFLYLTRIHYFAINGKWGEHEIDYVLFLRKNNITLDPNVDEVSELHWVSKDQMTKFVKNVNAPLTPWFELILKNKLFFWWDNLHSLDKLKENDTILRFT